MSAAMSERNKRLVRRALGEIYTKGDLSVAGELVHRDFVDHEPAHTESPTGPESVKQTVRSLQSAFSELHFEVEDEIAEGDKVVQLVTMSGRQTGPLMDSEPRARRSRSGTSTSGGSPTRRSSSTGEAATTLAFLGSSGSCRSAGPKRAPFTMKH
jgi:ketosteroid isomerase-like protein